jgi:hypothetical protein
MLLIKKLSKGCQKVDKNFSKSCQKELSKSCFKNDKKIVKKLNKLGKN